MDCLNSNNDFSNMKRIPKRQRNVRSLSNDLSRQVRRTDSLHEGKTWDRSDEAVLSDDTAFDSSSDDEFVDEFFDEMFGPVSDDTTGENATDSNGIFTDDEIFDEMLGELLGTNSTNETALFEEIDELLDEVFGPMDENSTNATTGGWELVEEVFDIPTDDAFALEPEPPVLNVVPAAAPIVSPVNSEVYPAPLNSTDGTSETRNDDNDAPKSPLIRSAPNSPVGSPTLPPRPVSSSTETPTMGQIHDDDQKDSQTEHDIDDDIFNEERYKSRPAGTIPGGSSVTAILGTLAAIAAMIFTAWQVSDNPDGIYASMCRLVLTCIQLVFRVLMSPCRKYLPCCYSYRGHMAGSNGYHEPYGHIPVSTMDYGYKDPALELT